jgi:hypothetical protein
MLPRVGKLEEAGKGAEPGRDGNDGRQRGDRKREKLGRLLEFEYCSTTSSGSCLCGRKGERERRNEGKEEAIDVAYHPNYGSHAEPPHQSFKHPLSVSAALLSSSPAYRRLPLMRNRNTRIDLDGLLGGLGGC